MPNYISTVHINDTDYNIKDSAAQSSITTINGDISDIQGDITDINTELDKKLEDAAVDGKIYARKDGNWYEVHDNTAIWGNITGTLSNQTDLSNALAAKEVSSNKVSNLNNPDNTTYPTTQAVSNAISTSLSSVMKIKGAKPSEALIKAITQASVGDVWINSADGSEWVCTTSIEVATPNAWEKLGYTVDLSDYVTETELEAYTPTANLGDLAFVDQASGSYTPAGNVSVTLNTTTVNSITAVGTLPSYSQGTFSAGTLPTHGNDSFSAGSLPSYTEGAFTQGTLPTWGATVTNEILSFSFSPGTLPSKAADSFSAGTLPSYTQGTFTRGTLPSHSEDTFSAGTLPTKGSNTTVATSVNTQTFTGTADTVVVTADT